MEDYFTRECGWDPEESSLEDYAEEIGITESNSFTCSTTMCMNPFRMKEVYECETGPWTIYRGVPWESNSGRITVKDILRQEGERKAGIQQFVEANTTSPENAHSPGFLKLCIRKLLENGSDMLFADYLLGLLSGSTVTVRGIVSVSDEAAEIKAQFASRGIDIDSYAPPDPESLSEEELAEAVEDLLAVMTYQFGVDRSILMVSSGDNVFYDVYTSKDEVPDSEEGIELFEIPFSEVLRYVADWENSNDDGMTLGGIVVNPFTDSFLINTDFCAHAMMKYCKDLLEDMDEDDEDYDEDE